MCLSDENRADWSLIAPSAFSVARPLCSFWAISQERAEKRQSAGNRSDNQRQKGPEWWAECAASRTSARFSTQHAREIFNAETQAKKAENAEENREELCFPLFFLPRSLRSPRW